MSEEALKKLEDELKCSICLDTYADPKLLNCFHVYCRECLVPLVDRDQRGRLGLPCPSCRQVTPTPERGVAGLKPAFHINRLYEIKQSFKNFENSAASPEGSALTGYRYCSQPGHQDKKLELYCETCGELVCLKCIVNGSKHQEHKNYDLKQAFEEYKIKITLSLESMEKQVTVAKETLAELDARCEEVSHQQVVTKGNLHATFGRLREVLNVRETKLAGQLHHITQRKLKSLAAQRDQIGTALAKLNSCIIFIKETLRPGNEGEALVMKANTVNRAKELTIPFHPDILKPITEADMLFSASADLTKSCQDYGRVVTAGLPGMEEKSSVSVHVVGYKPCAEPVEFYQPIIRERLQLDTKGGSWQRRGSPFSSSGRDFSAPVGTIGEVRCPWGVAINHRGEVVVAEAGGGCVTVFSLSSGTGGKKLQSFGTHGSRTGSPRGVAVDGEGNILTVDPSSHSIQRFTEGCKFLAAVGTKGKGPLQFSGPLGIAFNTSSRKVYVADTHNHRVQVLNSDLTFSSTFGREGVDEGNCFDSPYGIACDSAGKVYVADTWNHRIQVFTAEGRFLRSFGSCGEGKGELWIPTGVAVDSRSGLVYVSENGDRAAVFDRVSVFTTGGQFVTSFGTGGKEPGEFQGPRGLAVDNSGVVYVCDRGNDRVEMF